MDNFLTGTKSFADCAKSAVGTLFAINLLLAFIAVIRDIALASYLGTSAQADALLLAFFLPDTVGNNILAAAIAASSIPMFSRLYLQENGERFIRCANNTAAAFVLLSLLVFGAFFVFRRSIIGNFGQGFTAEISSLSLELFVIILPVIILYPLSAFGAAVLQADNRFNVPAIAPVLYNGLYFSGVVVAISLQMPVNRGVYLISYFIGASVLAMIVLVWSSLFRSNIKVLDWRQLAGSVRRGLLLSEDSREVMRVFFPYLGILLSMQSVLFVERFLASQLEVGSVAGLNYAYRLAQFPIWVFVAAVGMVILPAMSRAMGLGNAEELKSTFVRFTRLVLVISLPLSITLFVLRVPIAAIILQRGAFDQNSLHITTAILSGYSLSIVGQALVYLALRVYLARGRLITPLLITIFSTLLHIITVFCLVRSWGSAGIGYGAAIGASAHAALLYLFLKKDLGFELRGQFGHIAKILGANIPVLCVTILSGQMWSAVSPESGWGIRMLYVLFVVLILSFGYFWGLRRCKII